MSTNYIEVYRVDNKLNAKIHKNGKVCTLTNPNSIKKLLDICHKHNMLFNGKKVLQGNVDPIIREFDAYYTRIRKRNKRLKIIAENLDKVLENATLVKKNHVGKIVIATSLAATLGITAIGMNAYNTKTSLNSNIYETQTTIEEIPEYIEDAEALAPTINNIELDNISYENNVVEEVESIVNDQAIEEVPVLEEATPTEETIIVEEAPVVEENTELNQMMQADEFTFSYTDRTDYENITNAKRFEDLFIKYGNMYGVDPNILMAIAAQENCGKHDEALNSAYATGIMQIERSANLNSTVSAFNVQTGQMDSIYVTQEALEDLETNIQIGTMIFRNKLEEYNYNIPLSLQSYNFGSGNMANSLAMCSDIENIPMDELKSDTTNPAWLQYRAFLGVGDSQYVEHIFSFIESGTVLTVVDRDGNNISIKIVNENVNNLQMN